MIETILGAVDGLPIGIYDDRVIGSFEGFIDGDVEDKCLCCLYLKGMYTCKTGNVGKVPLCSCLCCCRGYVHM